jgi:octaprenyl-diphosphate synthase
MSVGVKTATIENELSPLELLKNSVADDLGAVNELIGELVKNKLHLITNISDHTFSAGGKRLRPLLTLACAQLVDYKGQAHIALATSVEFMHTATLLHDDVVDESTLRRGIPTANSQWGNKESILVGDFLLGKAFELMGKANSLEVYKILSNAALVISEGEVFQLSSTANINLSREDYFSIIRAKTGALFAAACEVSAAVKETPTEKQHALREYGMNLGAAFQIADDALDYATSSKNSGKNQGDDFREKKVTLPIILAYEQGNEEERNLLKKAFTQEGDNKELFSETLTIITKLGTVEQSLDIAKSYADIAHEHLNTHFEDSTMKHILLDLLKFVVNRQF